MWAKGQIERAKEGERWTNEKWLADKPRVNIIVVFNKFISKSNVDGNVCVRTQRFSDFNILFYFFAPHVLVARSWCVSEIKFRTNKKLKKKNIFEIFDSVFFVQKGFRPSSHQNVRTAVNSIATFNVFRLIEKSVFRRKNLNKQKWSAFNKWSTVGIGENRV